MKSSASSSLRIIKDGPPPPNCVLVYQHRLKLKYGADTWLAKTVIEGKPYEAKSKTGAANELARVLIAAGIDDSEVDPDRETAGAVF